MARQLDSWLAQMGLAIYGDLFAANQVDLDVLPDLTDDDLRELGIPLGHRKKLLKAIAALSTADDRLPSAAPNRQDGERRQLTVMFCDLVDSTALSARLDPEDLRDVILAYQHACARVIAEHGGHVAKYLGDGVLAYFGFPQAHEDDARRAARAALAIIAAIARSGAAHAGQTPSDVAVRIGIDTGIVVVGDVVGDGAAREAAVVGETPNIAARLQALAKPDQIVIGPLTHALIGDTFTFEDLGAQALKGVSRHIHAFVLTGERPADERGTHPLSDLPLVGRREEFALLCRAWDATKRGAGQAVLVRGEPGIGKSRLVDALRAHCASDDCAVVVDACSPYHTSATLHVMTERLKSAIGWRADDDADLRLARLEAHLLRHDLSLAHCVPLYAELLEMSVPDGCYETPPSSAQERREQLLDALAAELVATPEGRPVINVWEDIQWADATTLQLLGLCIDQSPTVPVLNVFTFRSEFAPPWPARAHTTQITLNRLEGADVQALVRQRAAGRMLPNEVVDYVLGRTDGVPLYVEEMTKALLETDFLREENGVYTIVRPLADAAIPATLHDLLMARLDRLPTIREVAQLGSVLGREFAYDMLQAIGELPPSTLHSGLDRLVDCELLYERGRRPGAKYVFRHALIHDAAYQSLLKRTRQYYHRQVAQMLEARHPDIVRTQPELLAHHYSRADEHDKAIEYLGACAAKAAVLYAHADAIAELRKARVHAEKLLADRRDRVVLGLVIREAESLHFLGARQEIVALLLAHRERLEALRAPAVAAEFHFWLGFAHSWLGHRHDAQACLDQGLREATDAGAERVVGRLHRALATECFYSGRPLEEAVAHARAGVALLTKAEDRFWSSQALFTLCYCCVFSGDFAEALDAARALRAFGDAAGASRSKANAAMLEGLCEATRGDGEAGRVHCEQALAVSPDRFETAFILACLGKSCLEADDVSRAVALLDQAVALAEEVRSLQFRAWFRTMLAEACLSAGDSARAGTLAGAAQQASADVGFLIGVGLSEHMLARVALAEGDVATAMRRVEAAMAALRTSGAKFELARTGLTAAMLAHRMHDRDAALAALTEAHGAFAELACPRYRARAVELAQQLGLTAAIGT
jgi:class 3 adenylate cyclase